MKKISSSIVVVFFSFAIMMGCQIGTMDSIYNPEKKDSKITLYQPPVILGGAQKPCPPQSKPPIKKGSVYFTVVKKPRKVFWQGRSEQVFGSVLIDVREEGVWLKDLIINFACYKKLNCTGTKDLSMLRLIHENGTILGGPWNLALPKSVQFKSRFYLPVGIHKIDLIGDVNQKATLGGQFTVFLDVSKKFVNIQGVGSMKSISPHATVIDQYHNPYVKGKILILGEGKVDVGRVKVGYGFIPVSKGKIKQGAYGQLVGRIVIDTRQSPEQSKMFAITLKNVKQKYSTAKLTDLKSLYNYTFVDETNNVQYGMPTQAKKSDEIRLQIDNYADLPNKGLLVLSIYADVSTSATFLSEVRLVVTGLQAWGKQSGNISVVTFDGPAMPTAITIVK